LWVFLLAVSIALGWGWQIGAQEGDLSKYRVGAQLYVENCGTCHIALPPEVMPTQTWQVLLQDPNHYGAQLQNLPQGVLLEAVWEFMRDFSRAKASTELTPYRLSQSRYFRALHPGVEFPTGIRPTGCIDCHPKANVGDFISLTPKWQ
jgi:hypothetical protein